MLELFNIPHIISTYGYAGISLIVFLESGFFFALPGDSLLFTAGLIAATGYLDIVRLILIIFVSTFLGGLFGYAVGVHLERLRRYSFLRRFLKEEYINKTHKFFDKYGKVAVIFCRFVPVVRTFTPIIAGIVRMHYSSFIKYNLLGSVLWSTSIPILGYFLGQIFPQIKDYMTFVIFLVVFLSIVPIIFEFFRKTKKPVKPDSF